MNWFEVDKKGLAKLIERQGKAFVIFELLQNAWDEPISKVEIELSPVENKRALYNLKITDDSPEGWKDLSHAYTLFAESYKKGDPAKRGKFNLGEKLVLALCDEATITTTKGTVIFNDKGRSEKNNKSSRTESGSCFDAQIRMTKKEFEEVQDKIHLLIQPENILTTFNGEVIGCRQRTLSFKSSLPTVIADEEGNIKNTIRKTTIELFEVESERKSMIYEMGIPVVNLGDDRYDINVLQKVPVSMSRDNVTPSYLKKIRVAVANYLAEEDAIDEEDVASSWMTQATSDKNITGKALGQMMDLRFGSDRVSFDPTDLEANKRAAGKEFTVVPGRSLNKDQWDNIREHDLIESSGSKFPTPKPYSKDGEPEEYLREDEWTDGMRDVVALAKRLAKHLMDVNINVLISKSDCNYIANYGGRSLVFSSRNLARSWFDTNANLQGVVDLLIHEFGHEYSGDHLSDGYHHALTSLAAKGMILALKHPEVFHDKYAKVIA